MATSSFFACSIRNEYVSVAVSVRRSVLFVRNRSTIADAMLAASLRRRVVIVNRERGRLEHRLQRDGIDALDLGVLRDEPRLISRAQLRKLRVRIDLGHELGQAIHRQHASAQQLDLLIGVGGDRRAHELFGDRGSLEHDRAGGAINCRQLEREQHGEQQDARTKREQQSSASPSDRDVVAERIQARALHVPLSIVPNPG